MCKNRGCYRSKCCDSGNEVYIFPSTLKKVRIYCFNGILSGNRGVEMKLAKRIKPDEVGCYNGTVGSSIAKWFYDHGFKK